MFSFVALYLLHLFCLKSTILEQHAPCLIEEVTALCLVVFLYGVLLTLSLFEARLHLQGANA